MEDGLHGLKDKDLYITISAIQNKDTIKLNNYTIADSLSIKNTVEWSSLYKFYKNKTSIDRLVSDIKENKKYVRGIGLDNVELIFNVQIPKTVFIFNINQELQLKMQNGIVSQHTITAIQVKL